MARRIVLVHGYSDRGESFKAWKEVLKSLGYDPTIIGIVTYETLTNEISIKDIAEGFDRALSLAGFRETDSFDAMVHSTGMLVVRSWLTTYGRDSRRGQLKHLIGLAPASFGSPLAKAGRSGIGAIFKGRRMPGPDFMEAGDQVLDALELASPFTWELAHKDLLGPEPFYGPTSKTPYVFTFCGKGSTVPWILGGPGSDGVVRWAGCALNARKIVADFTQSAVGERVQYLQWHNLRIPVIIVDGADHGTILSKPAEYPTLVKLVDEALQIDSEKDYFEWHGRAVEFRDTAQAEQWQQFLIRAVDERGDGITDFNVRLYTGDGSAHLEEFELDVDFYSRDKSYRWFHVNLDKLQKKLKKRLWMQIIASTGSGLVGYVGSGDGVEGTLSERSGTWMGNVEITHLLAEKKVRLFYPWTTTLIELRLDRQPTPLDLTQPARVCRFI